MFEQHHHQHQLQDTTTTTTTKSPIAKPVTPGQAVLESPLESTTTGSQTSDGKSSSPCWRDSELLEQRAPASSAQTLSSGGMSTVSAGGGEEGRSGGDRGEARAALECSSGGSSSQRASKEIRLNLSVSEFPELAFLAQGSMCKCFVAKGNPLWPAPVVLKMAIENGPKEAERDLNRELALLQNLSHPHLTALLGAGLTPKGKTFIAMEYLDRGTLRRRLDAARGGLGFWPAIRHALELASIMKYLHDEAIPGMCVMHRDLKPDNLGFSGNVMKLFDLGLAKLIRRSEAGVNDFYRMSGEVGSLRYMSPEVARLQPYNEKTDVHSFAVVTWELATGWLPYSGLSPEQFMFQAVEHGQRPLMQFGWDPVFKGLLSSCWAEDPRERPGFSQIHETLGALLAEKGAQAAAAPRRRGSTDGKKKKSSSSRFSGVAGVLSRMVSGRTKNRKEDRPMIER